MLYLVVVSLIWALSFGLIKGNLTGLDPNFMALVRLAVAAVVFLPFLRRRSMRIGRIVQLSLVGAVQFGVMYGLYNASYRTLPAYEVALFTIFTPLYVTLIHDLLSWRLNPRFWIAATLSVLGTGIAVYKDLPREGIVSGFLLVQGSNLCFAVGQILYRRVMAREPGCRDRDVFGWLYLGATLAAGAMFAVTAKGWPVVTAKQAWILLYLGAVASGLGFFLWNLGARRTNVGVLAVFNDAKIPLAIACSVLLFGERGNGPHLLLGGAVLGLALAMNQWQRPAPTSGTSDQDRAQGRALGVQGDDAVRIGDAGRGGVGVGGGAGRK